MKCEQFKRNSLRNNDSSRGQAINVLRPYEFEDFCEF